MHTHTHTPSRKSLGPRRVSCCNGWQTDNNNTTCILHAAIEAEAVVPVRACESVRALSHIYTSALTRTHASAANLAFF